MATWQWTLAQRQRAFLGERWIAEGLELVAECVGEAEQQTVVRHAVELQRAAGLEAEPAAEQYKRNVVERVAVALAEFVGPHDGGVVKHAAGAAGFGGL